MSESRPRTLFDKIWDSHVVERLPDGTCILYIDRHLLHEVTSPQAFEGLRNAGRKLRRPDLTIAVADHNIPTVGPRWRRGRRTSSNSAFPTCRSWMCGRASSTSSGQNWVFRCPARPSFAA